MTYYCKSHCRRCNSHFANDSTFDAHRVFEEGHKDDWDHRICADLDDDPRFGVKHQNGVCALASSVSRHPVRIWSLSTYLAARPSWGLVRKARRPS